MAKGDIENVVFTIIIGILLIALFTLVILLYLSGIGVIKWIFYRPIIIPCPPCK